MKLSLALPLVAITSFGALSAQNDPTKPEDKLPQQGQMDKTQSRGDTFLATWVAVANDNEIALAQYALGKTQNNEVKQFAQMMLDDHRKLATKLQQLGTGSGTVRDVGMDHGKTERPGDTNRPVDASGKKGDATLEDRTLSGGIPGEHLDHVALIRELGSKCLENSKRELDQKSGAEFDRCYMGMQIGGHMGMLTMLDVFPKHASEPLKRTLEEGKTTVKSHLEHAKDVAKKMESEAPAKTKKEPGADDRK